MNTPAPDQAAPHSAELVNNPGSRLSLLLQVEWAAVMVVAIADRRDVGGAPQEKCRRRVATEESDLVSTMVTQANRREEFPVNASLELLRC